MGRPAPCPMVDCSMGDGECSRWVSRVAVTPCCGRPVSACDLHARMLTEEALAKPNFLGFLTNPCARCSSRHPHSIRCGFCGWQWNGTRLRWSGAPYAR